MSGLTEMDGSKEMSSSEEMCCCKEMSGSKEMSERGTKEMSENEEEGSGFAEQCFYASFKIYLSPPEPLEGDNNSGLV